MAPIKMASGVERAFLSLARTAHTMREVGRTIICGDMAASLHKTHIIKDKSVMGSPKDRAPFKIALKSTLENGKTTKGTDGEKKYSRIRGTVIKAYS
jgi:hypothetical protein